MKRNTRIKTPSLVSEKNIRSVYDIYRTVDKVQSHCKTRLLTISVMGECFELIQKIRSFSPSMMIGFPLQDNWPSQFSFFFTSLILIADQDHFCATASRNSRKDIKNYITLSIDKKSNIQDFSILMKDIDYLYLEYNEDRIVYSLNLPSITTLKNQTKNSDSNYLTQKGSLPYCTNFQY